MNTMNEEQPLVIDEPDPKEKKQRAAKPTPIERAVRAYAMKSRPDDLADRVLRELHAMGVNDLETLRLCAPRVLNKIIIAAVQADAFLLLACAATEVED